VCFLCGLLWISTNTACCASPAKYHF
jgi:hypothetical protein